MGGGAKADWVTWIRMASERARARAETTSKTVSVNWKPPHFAISNSLYYGVDYALVTSPLRVLLHEFHLFFFCCCACSSAAFHRPTCLTCDSDSDWMKMTIYDLSAVANMEQSSIDRLRVYFTNCIIQYGRCRNSIKSHCRYPAAATHDRAHASSTKKRTHRAIASHHYETYGIQYPMNPRHLIQFKWTVFGRLPLLWRKKSRFKRA